MSIWTPSSEVAWAALADARIGESEVRTGPLEICRGRNPLYISLSAEGHRSLLIPLLANEASARPFRTKSVTVGPRNLIGPAGLVAYLEMRCVSIDQNARFAVIADEVVNVVGASPDEPPSDIVAAALARWRNLVSAAAKRMSDAEVVGMWGELRFLLDLTAFDGHAVELWKGPLREHHDFKRDLWALEVKTSLNVGNDVTINGAEQLQEPVGGALHLLHCHIAKVGNGENLTDLLRSLMSNWHCSDETRDALESAGVSLEHFELYDHLRFTRTNLVMYAVGNEFPRITAASFLTGQVPAGTSSLKYQLDLSSAQRWRLLTESMQLLILDFARG